MVGHGPLKPSIGVRIPVPQHYKKHTLWYAFLYWGKRDSNRKRVGETAFLRIGNYSKPRVVREERSDDVRFPPSPQRLFIIGRPLDIGFS